MSDEQTEFTPEPEVHEAGATGMLRGYDVPASDPVPAPEPLPVPEPVPAPEPSASTRYDVPAGDTLPASDSPASAYYDAYAEAPASAPAPVQPTAPAFVPGPAYVPQGTAPMPNPMTAPHPTASYYATPQQAMPQPGQVPPVTPVQQHPNGSYANAVHLAPTQPLQESSLSGLTGGMKFGWLCVGMLLGIPGMLIAWLVNVDKHPQVKKDAIVWSVIGYAIRFVLMLIGTIAFAGMMVAIADGVGGYYDYGGYYF